LILARLYGQRVAPVVRDGVDATLVTRADEHARALRRSGDREGRHRRRTPENVGAAVGHDAEDRAADVLKVVAAARLRLRLRAAYGHGLRATLVNARHSP